MLKRLVIVILLIGLLVGGIAAIKYRQFQAMQARFAKAPPPAVIASTTVASENWQPALQAVGSLVAVHGINVTTDVSGLVDKVLFKSGQPVKQGELLVKLDDTLDRAALDGLRASLELARVQYKRSADLLPKKAVSQSKYDADRAAYDVAQAKLAEEQVAIAKKSIRAPFSGRLGLRKVDPGDYLSPGTAIVSLRALDPIYVDYSLPQNDLPRLHVGMQVRLTTGAYPGTTFDGTVTALESGVDEGTRSIKLRATLDNPDGRLRPGMFVEVRTLLPKQEAVLTVPRTAISYNTFGNYVYVLVKDKKGTLRAMRRQVETGNARKGRVQVTEGLKSGEEVVRAGLVKLHQGQAVKVDNSVKLDDATVPSE